MGGEETENDGGRRGRKRCVAKKQLTVVSRVLVHAGGLLEAEVAHGVLVPACENTEHAEL